MSRGKLIRSCLLGDTKSCEALSLTIFSSASLSMAGIDLGEKHPNKMPFDGVLLKLDQASTKPPHGSRGHRILVPTASAKKRLSGLIGMGVNYDPGNLDEHVPRHKVGVITKAWIDGKDVKVKGFIYKKDFPEAEKHLKGRKDLGMSMELADVYVREENDPVWYLQDFQFTGATILRKDAAAYHQTALAAKAAAQGEGETMAKEKPTKKVKMVAAAGAVPKNELAQAIAESVRGALTPVVSELRAANDRINSLAESVQELQGLQLQAAAGNFEVNDDEEEVIAAAGEDEDDDEIEAAGEEDFPPEEGNDDGDEEDESEDDPTDYEAQAELPHKGGFTDPGELNKGAKNKGSKTTTTEVGASMKVSGGKPFPNLKSSSISAAATTIRSLSARAARLEHKLQIQAATHKKEMSRMGRLVEKMEAQMDRYAEQEARRSVLPNDLVNLAAKANIDLHEISASGQKMSVEQVDAMFAAAGIELEPVQRMAMKNRLLEMNVMDQGQVIR